MLPDPWHLTDDVDAFLARGGGEFLRSRSALHNTPLTDIETLRIPAAAERGGGRGSHRDAGPAVLGRLESAGEVVAICYLTPRGRLGLTPLSPERADALARQLAALGHTPATVIADRDTALAYAEAWQRHAGAEPDLLWRTHLYRLGTLTPPHPRPPGRGRPAGVTDR